MKATKILLLIAVVALLGPQVAAGEVQKNDIGLVVGYIAPTSDSTIAGATTEADSTVDYGLEYKHKFMESNRLSLGLSLLYSQFDVNVNGQKVGTIDNLPFLIDLNWHFLKSRGLYIGVTGGWAMWGNLDLNNGGSSVAVKDSIVYGVNLGWDISLGDHWAILTNVRYLGQKAELDDPNVPDESVTVNPIVANLGFAYRF